MKLMEEKSAERVSRRQVSSDFSQDASTSI
jgi:hypothetical protein